MFIFAMLVFAANVFLVKDSVSVEELHRQLSTSNSIETKETARRQERDRERDSKLKAILDERESIATAFSLCEEREYSRSSSVESANMVARMVR
jgi:predicted Holliday junction resolvase-like endonuclease